MWMCASAHEPAILVLDRADEEAAVGRAHRIRVHAHTVLDRYRPRLRKIVPVRRRAKKASTLALKTSGSAWSHSRRSRSCALPRL